MNQPETDVLKNALDEARRSLTHPTFKSRDMNFTAWGITAQLAHSDQPEEWIIQTSDRRVMHRIRRAIEEGSLVVYEDFISYLPASGESRRFASLRSTPAVLQSDNRTLRKSGPESQNRKIINLLEKQGAIIDMASSSNPVLQAGPWDVKLDGAPRAGRNIIAAESLEQYVDHHAHPGLLRHPLLRLFVEPRRKGAIPEPTFFDTGLFPASECPTEVGPSERRPQAEKAAAPLPSLDPDQTAARDLAMTMRPVLVNGPPGTGKSQTIAAIIEECMALGRRVIVTSTERSALDVARRRMTAQHVSVPGDVFIGSPQDLALVSPPKIGEPDFDLAVIDEASRMPLDLSLTVLARSRSVVVIGDDKQMRPETEGRTILDVATDLALPTITLTYHYRSQERSLISISNILAYGMSLRTVPTPRLAPEDGLKIIEMNGTATKAGDGHLTNRSEADAIVRWVIENGCRADRSIGILTANRSQRNLIAGLIENALPQRTRSKIGEERRGESLYSFDSWNRLKAKNAT